MQKIGIIGVGSMGSALISHLNDKGVDTVACDVTENGRRRANDLKVEVVDHPAAVAEAVDVTSVMVRTDDETLEAALGQYGALKGMSAGKILLLHSTIHPNTTRRIAEAARSHRVLVADAPIAGVPPVVRSGNGVALVGALPEDFARFEAHLRLMFRDAILMGPLGSGNVAKVIKNLTVAAEALVIAEAIRIGEAAGINYLAALEMMVNAEQFHFIDHWKMAFDPSGKSSEPLKLSNLYDKDTPLAGRIALELNVDAPITRELVKAAKKISQRAT
jgi:3-hydroxyisobutyrate dehydrogenase